MKDNSRYLNIFFVATDLLLINGLFALLLLIFPDIRTGDGLRELWLAINVAYLPAMAYTLSRRRRPALVMDYVARQAFITVFIHAACFLGITALFELRLLSTAQYLVYYGLMLVVLPLWWIVSRYLVKLNHRRGRGMRKVVIIGTGPTALRLTADIEEDTGYGYTIAGYFDLFRRKGFDRDDMFMGYIDDLEDFIVRENISKIYYACDEIDNDAFARIEKIADAHMAEMYFVPSLPHAVPLRYEVDTIGSTTLMSTRPNPLSRLHNRMLKRGFDICFASFALIFYPLIFIPVALAIKKAGPGPIYFRQKRSGYHGKEFDCLKFRTMQVNRDADTRQASDGDPRITRIGAFLRHSSIDEIPQFINVLKGDMSIVGPRPHMLAHTDIYSRLVDKYMVRLTVKPGITGWAQVNGYRGATDKLWKMEKRVKYDIWYVENWSLLLDFKIVVRTVLNAIHGEENAK